MKYTSFLLPLLLLLANARAQDPVMKFGDVPAEAFTGQTGLADSTASAIFLFDKASSFFQRTSGSDGFDVVYERHARIRLVNKNAFRLATMILSLYKKGNRSVSLDNFKGATYNLEDGKIATAKVDKSNIFKEQNGDYNQVKIAFPHVREGSVIEYTYRLIYPGFGFIPSWSFQGDFPVLWSEYEITFPSLFNYMIEKHGYLHYLIDTSLNSASSYSLSLAGSGYGAGYNGNWWGNSIHHIWAMENVPTLAKREPYTTTLANHQSRLDFQLVSINMQGYQKTFRSNWDQLVEELMKKDLFGTPLTDNNRWMSDELEKMTGPDKNSPEAVRKVYYYVRDHFNCSGSESMYLSQPLRKTWDDKKGNVADINLLLTALYLHLGLEAAPVILSSRGHGYAYESFPLLRDYNYVITRVKARDQYYLLDATKDELPFNRLPELCYNGSARVIDAMHALIMLSPDSITEKRNTVVVLRNSDTAGYTGHFSHTSGVFGSTEMRNRLKRTTVDAYFETIRKSFAPYKSLEAHGVDSLDNPDALLTWHYNMKYNFTSNRFYFNPIMHERMSASPFVSPDRYYPVEMPWRTDYTYSLEMEVPKGYQLDEAPKPERLLLGDGEAGFFDYRVLVNDRRIQLAFHLVLKKTNFPVNDYPELRDFYTRIINKQKEELIFKKIN